MEGETEKNKRQKVKDKSEELKKHKQRKNKFKKQQAKQLIDWNIGVLKHPQKE